MPVVDLLNPRAKIVRGFAHYEALSAEVAKFAAVTPDPIIEWTQTTVREDGQTWNALVCTEVVHPPPVEFGLIAGDSIHNFRTALDHPRVCPNPRQREGTQAREPVSDSGHATR